MADRIGKACWALVICFASFGCLIGGCDSASTSAITQNPKIEQSAQNHWGNLGWLGAKSIPVGQVVSVQDPTKTDRLISTGAVELKELVVDQALEKAGAKVGDIVVGVDQKWLPIKTDPTMDLIAMVEECIDRELTHVKIRVLRRNKLETIELGLDKESLDDGLPMASQRMVDSTQAALNQLSKLQAADGSFPSTDNDISSSMMSTTLAGLAFLSADTSIASGFDTVVSRCLHYVSSQYSQSEMPETDPLAAAYVIQFIAESDVDFLEENWLDVIAELTDRVYRQQTPAGGWHLENVENDDGEVDVTGTFVTNQVLLAIGALERKGFDPSLGSLKKACLYLANQSAARVPSSLDRRIKAILSAGTAAALVAINCDRSNESLNRMLNEAVDRLNDFYQSPCLRWPGLVQVALVSRQFGNETWLHFHNSTKFVTSALYETDGNVVELKSSQDRTLPFEERVDPNVWRLSHLILAQSMQSSLLRKSLALVQTESLDVRDHLGEKFVAPLSPDEEAERARRAAEITQMILEQLKESGVEVEESDLKRNKNNGEQKNR